MNREELEFRYFFNAGLDRTTGECDVEGSDVFQNGHYVGSINWVHPMDIAGMEDDELEDLLITNGILV